MNQPPMLVLTCGNALAGDDGVGPRVAQTLDRLADRGIRIRHVPFAPGALADASPECAELVIVDAAMADHSELGEIIEISPASTEDEMLANALVSSHGWSMATEIALADVLGKLPASVRMLAVSVGPCPPGGRMSTAVRKAAARVCRRILSLHYLMAARPIPAAGEGGTDAHG